MERNEKIRKYLLAEYAKGTPLAKARKIVAKKIGDPADGRTLLGFDGVYFRATGLDAPLTRPDGTPILPGEKIPARTLRTAVARRRRAGGNAGRWAVLAASVEASIGRRVSEAETKRLAEAGGVDLDASYVGRGTRVGAPATAGTPEAAVEEAIS